AMADAAMADAAMADAAHADAAAPDVPRADIQRADIRPVDAAGGPDVTAIEARLDRGASPDLSAVSVDATLADLACPGVVCDQVCYPDGQCCVDTDCHRDGATCSQEHRCVYTVSLRQGVDGYSGVSDTYLNKWDPDMIYGDRSEIYVREGGNKVILVKYDLSPLPAGAIIIKATLLLTFFERSNSGELDVGSFMVQTRWNASEANWVKNASGEAWCVAGCGGAGTDYLVPASASEHFATASGMHEWNVTDFAKHWLDDPGNNQGVLLLATSHTAAVEYGAYSSDSGNVAGRPTLYIDYELP
ncbi:MAG: DNRLRE domain-containing protein, partial [Deltaproteobacteria bacterium]|nr:DNRLRE domain-containing protein [Deltaproteobacteria bacterium]